MFRQSKCSEMSPTVPNTTTKLIQNAFANRRLSGFDPLIKVLGIESALSSWNSSPEHSNPIQTSPVNLKKKQSQSKRLNIIKFKQFAKTHRANRQRDDFLNAPIALKKRLTTRSPGVASVQSET